MNARWRTVTLAVVALSLLLAGCAGDASDSPANASAPESTPAQADPVTLATVDYPDGLSEEGVEDPKALMKAHSDALSGTDYTLTLEPRAAPRNWSYTVRSNVTSKEALIQREVTGKAPLRVTKYFEGDAPQFGAAVIRYRKVNTSDGYPTYDAVDYESEFEYFHTRPLSGHLLTLLQDTQFTARKVVKRNGHVFIEYTLTSAESYDRSRMGTVLVRSDGLIASVQTTGAIGNGTAYSIRYDTTGNVTVTAPPWKGRALAASTGSGSSTTGGDMDCSDFSSQAAAQDYYLDSGGSDGLDGDGDGVACEG